MSLTSKALSRLQEVSNPAQKKVANGLKAIDEERKYDFKTYDANKRYEIKPTDGDSTVSGKMDKLNPISVHEFYEFKINHLDDTDSKMEKDLFLKRKNNIVRMMRENRPIYDQLVTMFHFLNHALGQVDFVTFEKIRDESAEKDLDGFKQIVLGHFSESKFKDQITGRVAEFVVNPDMTYSREKLDLLIEFVSIFPLAIKNSSNAAPGMDLTWKDARGQQQDAEKADERVEARKEKETARQNPNENTYLTGLLSFIWNKFEVKNGGNTRESFLFLDKDREHKVTRA